jgi:putative transposase/transposase-like zinc-binding protein
LKSQPTCAHRRRPWRRLELADLVRDHGDDLRAAKRLNGEQLAALGAIERCRTPALGGIREVCVHCGAQRVVWRSCRNRHCPKCQTVAKQRWLEARLDELLPVDYVHVVFTLPHELNELARIRPRLVYGLLFQSAADTLLDFARDPRHLGAEPGILAVLHTWGQNLSLHIHLHCIVTAGGLDPTRRRWIRRPGGYLFPVHALSRVFRGKYLAALRRRLQDDTRPARSVPLQSLRRHPWVVYAKRPFRGPRSVLDYLARYTHRVALTNDRLLGIDDDIVRLRWRDYAHGGKRKVLRLRAYDLLGRFVLHVLPHGFRRVRHYGLLGNRHRSVKLAACRRYFGLQPVDRPSVGTICTGRPSTHPSIHCPVCGSTKFRREPVASQPPVAHARAPTNIAC